jgi:hypothetical protein
MTKRIVASLLVSIFVGCSPPAPDGEGDAAIGDGGVDGGADGTTGCVTPGDPVTAPLRGACPLEDRLGGFEVYENGQYYALSGEIANGVVPLTVLEEIGSEGDCKLLRRPNPFCSPSCGSSDTCSLDGECVPYPLSQDVGIVRFEGLAECLELQARFGNKYYDTELPQPAFAAGDLVRMTTGEGTYGPLELWGVGVTPLQGATVDWTLEQGTPLPIQWIAAPEGARSRVLLHVNIDQHGATPLTIVCEVADTGQYEISATLVDDLFAAGVSGFPNAGIPRQTVDARTIAAGCVDLVVASKRTANVTVVP